MMSWTKNKTKLGISCLDMSGLLNQNLARKERGESSYLRDSKPCGNLLVEYVLYISVLMCIYHYIYIFNILLC